MHIKALQPPHSSLVFRMVLLVCCLFTWFQAIAGSDIDQTVLTTSTGEPFDVYVAGPEDAVNGVLLVHDWFGVSPFYLEAVQRLAQHGYRVVAVDVYDGQRADNHKDAWALMSALDTGAVSRKIGTAIESFSGHQTSVASIGFSMGAAHAMTASLEYPQLIKATVIFYGDTVNDPDAVTRIGGPVLAIYGSKDGPAADNAAAFSKLMDEAGAGAEIHIFPGAHHAFAQPLFNEGKTYDPEAAQAAWRLTEDFLARKLTATSETR